MNEEKTKRILRHFQMISLLVDCIDIEMHQEIIGSKFSTPALNNHVRRIKESIERIHLGISLYVKQKDRDQALYEASPQIHRLVKYFSMMHPAQLEKIMDAYEQYDKENPPTEEFKVKEIEA